MGLIDAPDPVSWIEGIKDENQKRALISVSSSIGYSQYVTALYEAGKAIEGKPLIGIFSQLLVRMAASAYKILLHQADDKDGMKLVWVSVPAQLAEDQKLLDSIHYEKEKKG